MKKIGIMTLGSRSYNYGGTLQEYALCKVLNDKGYDAEVIDFDQSSEIYTFSYKRSLFNLNLNKILSKVNNKASNDFRTNISSYVSLRQEKFDLFRTEYIKLSESCNAVTLKNVSKKYDVLICGSDQVWNPNYNIPEYFLNFANEHQKRIIYGASLGQDNLSRRQLRVYKRLMSDLNDISVREDAAKKVLQPITDSDIKVVLDPTLLLNCETYESLIKYPSQIDSDYIFCYFLDNNLQKQVAAQKISKELGLKIVVIPYLHDVYEKNSEHFGDVKLSYIGPQEFLGLIHNANLILTDSFHATVFSILFRKNFWTFGRDFGSYNMNSRIHTLLRYFELSDRFTGENIICGNKNCDYQTQYAIFENKKLQSLNYLKNAIS